MADTPKKDVSKTTGALKESGIKNIVILSGDKQTIVSKLTSLLDINQAYGDLFSIGKVEYVEKMKSEGFCSCVSF